MSSEDRKLQVLRAIVEDFVSTNEPVGSKALVDRHNLGVSPATIRNDMATLEDEGYIAQPHTSAGRIPTDKGYRLFVDRVQTVKPLSAAERRAIESFLGGAVDLDDVVRRTVRLLAQLTRQVAVVQYPSLTRSSVRHLELVSLSTTRLMVVLITDTGRVEQRVVELPDPMSEDDVGSLRSRLNAGLRNQRLAEATQTLAVLPDAVEPEQRAVVTRLASVLLEAMVEHPDERIALGGTGNLDAVDFPDSMRPVLDALEEQVTLLRLFGEAAPSALRVRIGEENPDSALRSTSIVSTGYGLGGIGVLGPTRMDYAGTMSAVRAVARYVGDILSAGSS